MLTQSKNQSDRRITSCVFNVDYFPRALKTCSNVKESHYYVYIVILFRQRNEKPNDVSAVTIEDKTLSSCRAGRSSCWTKLAWQKSGKMHGDARSFFEWMQSRIFFHTLFWWQWIEDVHQADAFRAFGSEALTAYHAFISIVFRSGQIFRCLFYFLLSAQKNVPGRATKLATFHVLSSLTQ